MRITTRVKISVILSLFVLATMLGTFLLSGMFSRGQATHAAGVTSYAATKGVLAPAAVVDPLTLANDPTAAPTFPKSARLLHTAHGAAPAAASASIKPVPVSTSKPGLLENFNGVSSRNSAKDNFGLEFEPPDQGLCEGNGFVVEPVNSSYTIYHTDGSVVAGPFNVNKLFGEGFKQFTSDPRCFFDKTTNTWFAIILFLNSTFTRGRTDIAVNPSGDPTTPWTIYHLPGSDLGGNGCPCFGDQPLLGIDQDNLYISTNEFSIFGPEFNGAQIYALAKSDLVSLASSVHFVHFSNLTIGGAIAASVQPAISFGSPDAEYFMNSLDPNGTFDDRIGVWAMTNRGSVSTGGIPTLSSIVIGSEVYGVPPGAQQKGASSLLDSGDDRMQQVQFINGDLWGELTTAVTIPGDTAERAGAAWFKVQPQLSGNTKHIASAHIANQGYVTVSGSYLIYPALQASPNGTAAIVMTLSGTGYFPSAVYTRMGQGKTSFGAVHIAAHGTGPYSPSSTRWGDYSWAILSPDGESFWMATEYMPPLSSQTPDGMQNWGTRVIQVSAE
jgi:hypothetical protein